jgi:YVTN family beta-propeller protein
MRHIGVPLWRRTSARRGISTYLFVFLLLASAGVAGAVGIIGGFGDAQVTGETTARGILLPTHQWLTPLGARTLVSNGQLLSSALSPDGMTVAALTSGAGGGPLTLINVKTGKIIQQIGVSGGDGSVGADGPLYSPDGKTLWFPQSGDLARFSVNADGTVDPSPTIVELSGPHGAALPSGMALSADGSKLYVALNGSDTLGVIDTATNRLVSEIPVGNAPRQVVLVGNKAFVSNEGGRAATAGDFTDNSDGTPIVASNVTAVATTGTVSVVDLTKGQQVDSIPVGLEPSAEHLAADGTLMVANSNDDSVSLIDTSTDRVTQTFRTDPLPGSGVGSYPNAITMTDQRHILVSIGRDNAIAVYRYNGPVSPVQFLGLLPTDWYPVNVELDKQLGEIVVTNDKGIGARGPESTINEGPGTSPATGHNSHDVTGSVTVFGPPDYRSLRRYTRQVFVNNDWEHVLASTPLHRADAAPRAVPQRLGEPSKIKHVFLIIKENRTYDQVLGDIGKGNSDPSLAQFGATVTPNLHALANRYGLFDNFYDEGTLSADGHQWLVQGDANDYLEKEFGAFYRSYPYNGGDPLAYQRDGFIWNAAERVGDTAANFGEYANAFNGPSPRPTWSQWYQDSQILEGKASGPLPVPENQYQSSSDIPSLQQISDLAYPHFDTSIPDQYRADVWLQSFKQSEATGRLANLNLFTLGDDHTSGVNGGTIPYPTAQVADNDLAVGRIVDTISHSQFWSSSAIFILEDDPQAGVDHVDGHRSGLFVISPYASRGVINSSYYTQINVVKTIEQMLGIPPMNQEDLVAEPMFNAFTDTPDLTPYNTLPNEIPLTYGLTGSTGSTTTAATAAAGKHTKPLSLTASPLAAAVPASIRSMYRRWVTWTRRQDFSKPDQANPAQLNRVDWYSATGWTRPYPGDNKILPPDHVPGRNLPAADIGDG